MEQPPGFVAQGKYQKYVWHVILVVYVDDIVITSDDANGIARLKQFLQKHFQTKDLGKLRYFLGIEVVRSWAGINLSQRKYVLDLLDETGFLGARPVDISMDPNVKLLKDEEESFVEPGKYRRLVGKLNYLTITRSDISYAVSIVSQFLNAPRVSHGKLIEGFTDADWADSPSDRQSTTGFCTFLGGNLVSWKSKKQTIVTRSSAEVEYRAMAHTTSELAWLQHFLQEISLSPSTPIPMFCDNQAALHIASNPILKDS
ncbi:uncharacterized protein LOC111377539 [Olea europaea var. sylvestris]|uniref:uncharacterized protein LOC111377539 n=1 Tax=Olea europaea var. sylvestris TaxID=158386 RepID=UPI000C1D6A52|nr:uncharacterized protein LOC111377539 [Olea europaea var. sylvestris]